MRCGLFSGSFDPITLGHTDLIGRASPLFDRLYVVIFVNSEKSCMFTAEERKAMVEASIRPLDTHGCEIICEVYDGLVADYVKEKSITAIVRGARNAQDFDYECMISTVNKTIYPGAETIILPSAPEYCHISSTVVREMLKYGRNLEMYIPKEAIEIIRRKNK